MKRIEIHTQSNPVRGGVLLGVLVICTALLVLSAALFSSLTVGDRVTHKSMLRTEAREGAEAALALATAEINRRAVAFASFGVEGVMGMVLNASDVATLVGTTGKSNLVATSVEIQPGYFSMQRDNTNLRSEDPAYSRDDSKGITVSPRYGRVPAMASVRDPITGATNTSYVEGLVQLRERAWFNYGFFFNMDMEVYPGPPMHVYGAVHTNADLYLGSDGNQLYLHKMVTAAGHIYRGIKYCLKAYNADGSITGFENKTNWGTGSTYPGEGTGRVYCTKNNIDADVEMVWSNDCLGTKTSPTANLSTWIDQQKNRWNSFVMDKSLNVDKFTPPALPLYVPENYETSGVTELRNHGYAMIEPQLPYTSNNRYYGRKSDDAENLKWSALAGMTIVVDDVQRAFEAGQTGGITAVSAATSGHAIPWKLVWYTGSLNENAPLDKENLPKRGVDGLPIRNELDPFSNQNDEVDAVALGWGATDSRVTMQRNLKALLRDCIVVVPYRDSGHTAGSTYGTGTTAVTIQTFPIAPGTSCPMTSLFFQAATTTRYNQPAGSWPAINTGTIGANGDIRNRAAASHLWMSGTAGIVDGINTANDRYPKSSSNCAGAPSIAANAYSGLYDRRQGYNGAINGGVTAPAYGTWTSSTDRNVGLTGAMHVVYIDLQKLNWIINHPTLWLHPTTGNPIYNFDKSYNNIVYVDLPSDRQNVDYLTRSGLPSPDNICHAQRATNTTPGYAVMLINGGRLPRLPSDMDSNDERQLRTPGFTLATNGPLYIKGNYNADGNAATGTSLYSDQDSTGTNPGVWYGPDSNREAEIPALVAADCVMFLSQGFRPDQSNRNKFDQRAQPWVGTATRYDGYGRRLGVNDTTPVSDNFLEISTAIVTGLTPTIPDRSPGAGGKNQQSGAVNNLPRFLEDFNGSTVRYRGSMAALYDCEVLTKRFIQNSHGYWFDPPNRDWGYHAYFAAGNFPPGTPVVRSARLMNVKEISAAQYAAGPQQPD